jgi:ArsR family transcriptional regulator
MTDTLLPDARLAAVAKALAHPARVEILRTLAARGTCACGEIVDGLPLAQATVSQHLKVLREAGLVLGTADGARSCYCLNRGALAAVGDAFAELFSVLADPGDGTCTC